MTKQIKTPKIVRGGIAVPLGNNFYYMRGRKHEQGGIDVGTNPKTGLEVEDGEVMQLTNKNIKVYSSVPFLNGKSPAQKVLDGENPNNVFNAQENYKDRKGLNDDGTKKRNGGIYMIQTNNKTKLRMIPSTGKLPKALLGTKDTIISDYYKDYITNKANINPTIPDRDTYRKTLNGNKNNKVGEFIKDNPSIVSNTIGGLINTIGAINVNRINKKTLDKLDYNVPLLYNTPNKLKTTININSQLDKMRETLANYEKAIDRNTASSKVALARKQQARLNTIEGYNQLYSDKENKETELINEDRLNQQEVISKNTEAAREWYENKNLFDNTILEKKAENNVDLINSINSIIQNSLTNINKAYSDRQNRLAMLAAYPNVNPRILRDLGIKGITQKDIDNWDKVNGKKRKTN